MVVHDHVFGKPDVRIQFEIVRKQIVKAQATLLTLLLTTNGPMTLDGIRSPIGFRWCYMNARLPSQLRHLNQCFRGVFFQYRVSLVLKMVKRF